MSVLRWIDDRVNDWFMRDEPRAAGRMGLFRVLFALYYLWHMSSQHLERLSGLPGDYFRPVEILRFMPDTLSPAFFGVLESLLVAALVLLAIGLQVRFATAVVLVVGVLLEAFLISLDTEHAGVLLVFYIPFFMLLCDGWGATYSLDALLHRRRGGAPVDPGDASWVYILPARAVLIMLVALFGTAAAAKTTGDGTWLTHWDIMSNHVLIKNVKGAAMGLPINPLAPWISQTPLLHIPAQIVVVVLEGLMFLALFSRRLLPLFFAVALVFHSVNALWHWVTFTPVVIGYAVWIDWEWGAQRLGLHRLSGVFDRFAPSALVGATSALAVGAGLAWNANETLRSLFNLGGRLDWQTLWIPILPLALAWGVRALVDLAPRRGTASPAASLEK